MKNKKRYQPFLATSSKKYLKVGFILSLALVITAFQIPFFSSEPDVIYFQDEKTDELNIVLTSTVEIEKKKTPPKSETKKTAPVTNPIDFIIDEKDKEPERDFEVVDPEDLKIDDEVIVDVLPKNVDPVWNAEKMPKYKRGDVDVLAYMKKVGYCEQAKLADIEGQVVVTFTVSKTGKVKDVKLEKGLFPCLDKAAVEHIKKMPDWEPGEQGLSKVDVRMVAPFHFELGN